MTLYTGFSNYKEENQDVRQMAADDEPSFWKRAWDGAGLLNREQEFREYREKWNRAATDPSYIPEIPLCVTIDASSACNFKCQGCHQSLDNNLGDLGMLKWEDATRIIDQCVELGVPSLSFTQVGEPGLNKALPEMVRYAHKRGILETRVVSNAQSPHGNMLVQLAAAGLHRLIISLDGLSPGSFEKYRRGSDFYLIMQNVFELLQWKRKRMRLENTVYVFPILRIQCVRTTYNESEIDAFVKFWSGMIGVDDVRISDITNREYGKSEVSTIWAGDQVSTGRTLCPQPRARLVFTDKADVALPCCHDWRKSYALGDIRKQSLLEIWNSEKLKELRKAHVEGRHDEIPMCKGCGEKASHVWGKK